jgi:hypothetical protein
MSRTIRLAALAAAALVLAGCATLQVTSRVEPGADLTQLRVFAWEPADAYATGDPRLDNNPFFHDYLQGAVERQLLRRGYVEASTADLPPDLLLHYHASVNQRMEIDEPDPGCVADNCKPGVIEYEQGTLVVDAVDAKTKRVVWRGWAQESVQGIIDSQDKMEEEIDRIILQMLQNFPTRL